MVSLTSTWSLDGSGAHQCAFTEGFVRAATNKNRCECCVGFCYDISTRVMLVTPLVIWVPYLSGPLALCAWMRTWIGINDLVKQHFPTGVFHLCVQIRTHSPFTGVRLAKHSTESSMRGLAANSGYCFSRAEPSEWICTHVCACGHGLFSVLTL